MTGGIRGSFHFGPVEPSANKLKLTLPPLYIYRYPEKKQTLDLAWPREGEQAVSKVFCRGPGAFILQKVAREDKKLAFYFAFRQDGDKPPLYYRPEFRLQDKGFWKKHIQLEWPEPARVKVTFPLPEGERVVLQLRSVGERVPRLNWEINAVQ